MKYIDIRYIKPSYSYQLEELADLYKIHINTIRGWVHNEGLPLIDGGLPFFIHGSHLIEFLNHRQSKNKRQLALVECYCCKCRAPRRPTLETISVTKHDTVYTYTGKCNKCPTQMCKIVSSDVAKALQGLLSSNTMEMRLSESDLLHPNHQTKEPEYMVTFNAENERIKWNYFQYEKEANGKCTKTIDKIRKGLIRYEEFTGHAPFKKFDRKIAIAFKNHLIKSPGALGTPLKLSTISHTLRSLQAFLKWLALQSGHKKAIHFDDVDYLNLSTKDRQRIAPGKMKAYPSLDEISRAIESFRPSDEIQMRNRALLAFLLVTGVRDGALIGLKLKHVDTARRYVIQDPAEVATKFGKLIHTKFFPVGATYHQIVIDWVAYLRGTKLFTDSDPLFPRDGLSHNGEYSISRGFLSAKHWKTAAPVRKIVRAAFVACGLKPYPPHRFRDTLADLGRRHCRTSDEQMAWAQNLGHKHFATTFGSYGNLSPERQFQLIEAFRDPAQDDEKLLGLTVDKLVGLLSPKLLERLEAESGRKEAD